MDAKKIWAAKYDPKNLLGLTPTQVIQKLGKPTIIENNRGTIGFVPASGPFVFEYYEGAAAVDVVFGNNRVVQVGRGER